MSDNLRLSPPRLRTLQVFSLVYLLEGRGDFLDAHTKRMHSVGAGDLLCLFPGIGHVYAPLAGTVWNELSVEFVGPVFEPWMGAGMLDPRYPIRRLEPIGHWSRRIHEVVLPLARPGAIPGLKNTGAMLKLIGEMCDAWQTPDVDADIQWANEARHMLRALLPQKRLDLEQMGGVFGLGEQAFRKRFKRLCGVTPTEYRSRHLIEQACQMLMDPACPVKRVSHLLGFGSEFYFSRRFRQVMGMTPREYRQRALH